MRVPLYDKTKSLSQSTAVHSSMVSVGSNSTLEERGRVTERFLEAAPSTWTYRSHWRSYTSGNS